jgi:hypothetical protein
MFNNYFRWIYQRSFVADGNFKADHVRQPHPENDIWLSEGGGMTAKRSEYYEFLKTAINRQTASYNSASCLPRLKT